MELEEDFRNFRNLKKNQNDLSALEQKAANGQRRRGLLIEAKTCQGLFGRLFG